MRSRIELNRAVAIGLPYENRIHSLHRDVETGPLLLYMIMRISRYCQILYAFLLLQLGFG